MSFLTVMELLPLLGAVLIATVNKDKEDAIKKMAFLTTLIVAVAGTTIPVTTPVPAPRVTFGEVLLHTPPGVGSVKIVGTSKQI